MRRWIPLLVLFFGCLGPRAARADRVDELVKQLQNNPEYKVRLTAVLSLAKYADPRAVDALTATVAKDSEDPRVRGFAAMGLGRLRVPSAGPALLKASRSTDPFLKSKAAAALEHLCPSRLTGKKFYVNLEKAKASGPLATIAKSIMVLSLAKVIGSRNDVVTGWPKCGRPTAGALQKERMTGFFADMAVTVTHSGGKVSCKVSVLFTTYPGQSLKGNAGAKAEVDGSLDADTLSNLIEQLVASIKEDISRFLDSGQ
jgi:hypothetical protein